MISSMIYLGFVLVVAFFFAKLEIQIEGDAGWAQNLPTWRVEKHPLLDVFLGGRPLTGYHAWAFSTVFLLFHAPFFFGGGFSLQAEAKVLGGYAIFWLVEDFLWFVLNPAFGVKRFTREHIWWHKRWFLGLPQDYWIWGTPALTALLVL